MRPAAYCGIVGFKPTSGAIPIAGVYLFSNTLDTVGTFTRTVAEGSVAYGSPLEMLCEIEPLVSSRNVSLK